MSDLHEQLGKLGGILGIMQSQHERLLKLPEVIASLKTTQEARGVDVSQIWSLVRSSEIEISEIKGILDNISSSIDSLRVDIENQKRSIDKTEGRVWDMVWTVAKWAIVSGAAGAGSYYGFKFFGG